MKIKSIVVRTLLVSISLTLVALLIVLIISVQSSSNSMEKVIAEELMNKASMTGQRIDEFYEQRIRDARVVSQADVLEGADENATIQYFKEITEANPTLANIWVLKEDRKSLFGTKDRYEKMKDMPLDLEDLVDSLFVAKQGDVFLTDAINFEKGISVFLMTPITDDTNTIVISALIIQVDFAPVKKMVSVFNDNVIGDKFVFLLNDDSEVIATDDPNQPLFELFKDLSVRDNLLRSTEIDGATGYEIYNDVYDVEVMAGMADMEAHGVNNALDWGIVAVAEISAIAAPAKRLRNYLILFTLLIAAIIVVIMAIFLRYSLAGIGEITKLMRTVSRGNIAEDVHKKLLEKSDEIGEMAISMNDMLGSLRNIVHKIKSGSGTLAISSNSINVSARNISVGANDQASTAEELSASMEEMSSAIIQNTKSAKNTEQNAKRVASNVQQIKLSVDKTTQAMRNIAESVFVINDITNKIDMLAINASIEAAKAGDHGKGFVIVANEVRKLAESSQRTAQKIESVTHNSMQTVENNSQLLGELLPDIQNTLVAVQEIAAASVEQQAGTKQINLAVHQLNQVVQGNSAASEELHASSDELLVQADDLKKSVEFFITEKEDLEIENTEQLEEQIAKIQEMLQSKKKRLKNKKGDKEDNSETTENKKEKEEEPEEKETGVQLDISESQEDENFEDIKT